MTDLTSHNPQRWRIYAPAILLILGAIIYCLYWFVMAGRVEQNTALWAEQQRERGYDVRYTDLSVKGFPYRFEAHFTDFTIAQPGHPNDWSWSSDKMIAMMLAYRFNHIIFEGQGQQRFAYIEDLGPEARMPYRFTVDGTAEVMRGSAALTDGKVSRMSIDIQGLTSERIGDTSPAQTLNADRIQLHVRQSETESASTDLFFKADMITLPTERGLETQEAPVDLIQLKLTFNDLAEEDLFAPRAFAFWAEQGGTTEISDLALTWDTAGIVGDGQVQLDQQARANGRINLSIYGHGTLISNLVDMGMIRREDGQMVDAALNLVALLAGNEDGRIDTPFEFRKGKIYLGPAQIGSLPPIYFN